MCNYTEDFHFTMVCGVLVLLYGMLVLLYGVLVLLYDFNFKALPIVY